MARKVKWLNKAELQTWRNFSLMELQLFALLGRELDAEGISYPDYLVLAHLSDCPENRIRMVELGCNLGWEKSRVSHHIARMERRGLVGRAKCPTDQRGWFVTMTDEGREAITRAAPGHVTTVRKHFIDLLSKEQLATLDEVAQTVLASLAE